MERKYRGFRVYEQNDGRFERRIETLDTGTLPGNEVLVQGQVLRG